MNGPADADDDVGVVSADEGVDSVVALEERLDDAGGGVLPDAQPASDTTASVGAIPNFTLRTMQLNASAQRTKQRAVGTHRTFQPDAAAASRIQRSPADGTIVCPVKARGREAVRLVLATP